MSDTQSNAGEETCGLTDDDYRKLFEELDTDRDGKLSKKELIHGFRTNPNIKKPRLFAAQFIHYGDDDHDQKLTLEEFLNVIHNPTFKHRFIHHATTFCKWVVPHPEHQRHLVASPRRTLENIERGGGVQAYSAAYDEDVDEIDGIYENKYKFWPPPFILFSMSFLEIAFFIADAVIRPGSDLDASGTFAQTFLFDPELKIEAWRYLTYMFVHVGHVHIITNCLVQLVMGIPLEMVHGHRILTVYLVGVVAGSVATSAIEPSIRLAGASAGVYAIIFAHGATIIMNYGQMEIPWAQLLVWLIIVVPDFSYSVYNYTNAQTNIGYVAHFGGALAGLLVGIFVLRNMKVEKWEKYVKYVCMTVFSVLFIACFIVSILR